MAAVGMNTWLLVGLIWLGLSIVAAPVFGRLLHDPRGCELCARKRHQSFRRPRG